MPNFIRDNWKRLTMSGTALLLLAGWFVGSGRRSRQQPTADSSDAAPESLTQPDTASPILPAVTPAPAVADVTAPPQPADPASTRHFIGRLVGAVAVILMLLSGENFRWEPAKMGTLPVEGLHFMLAGALTLAVSVWLVRPTAGTWFHTAHDPLQATPVRWRYVIGGTLALLLMAEANGRWLFKDFRLSQHFQAILFVGGAGLVAYGCGGFNRLTIRGLFRRSLLPLWLIVLVGFLLRIWQLEESVRFLIDEMHFIDGVLHLWHDPTLPLLSHVDSIAVFPHFFSYVERWTVALFGNDFFGIRFTSVLFGTLTIVAVYTLGCAIGSRKTGLTAAALLALFAPHIHFSRLAMNNIADPLFGTLALALLVRALRHNVQRDYVLAGLFLGMAGYFYEGGRLLFTAVCAAWLILMLIFQRPPAVRRGVLMFVIVAALVLLPYYYYALSQRTGITMRLTSEVRLAYLLRDLQQEPAGIVLARHYETSLRPALLHTVYAPDGSLFYYGGATGILPWYVVPWFFMGLFYALLRLRPVGILLWLWLSLGLVGISMVVSTDWTVRFLALFPALVVATALGLNYLLDLNAPLLSRGWRNVCLLLLVVSLGATQVSYYFEEHLTLYNIQIRRGAHDFQEAFDRAAQIPFVNSLIYITDDYIFPPILDVTREFRNISMGFEIWKVSEGFEEKLNNLPNRNMAYVFAISPGDALTLAAVRKVYAVQPVPWSAYDSVPLERQYLLYITTP